MGTIIKGSGTAEGAAVAQAVEKNPDHVTMVLLDKDRGTIQKLDVHKNTVKDHQELGWAVVQEV